jgi:hypothetical protein
MAYARQLRLRLMLALVQAERKATTESPLEVPVRLLPAALDAVAFMAIWTGFARPVKARRSEIAKRRRPHAQQGPAQKPRWQPDNDNVVPLSAA